MRERERERERGGAREIEEEEEREEEREHWVGRVLYLHSRSRYVAMSGLLSLNCMYIKVDKYIICTGPNKIVCSPKQ